MTNCARPPANREALLRLADRVEREEPSRELDAEIACALRSIPDHAPEWLRRWGGDFAPMPDGYSPGQICAMNSNGVRSINWPSPSFTTSLDAAVTLVLAGAYWICGFGRTRPDEPLYGAQVFSGADCVIGEAETDHGAAAALCAAALRAIAAPEPPDAT